MNAHDATSGQARRGTAARPAIDFEAGAARVVFAWQGDRWAHCLALATGTLPCEWQSLDGPWPTDGDPRWPASPVLVELSRVDRSGESPAILGVGMAGRSHFSASVSRDPLVTDAVRFEIACRLHDGPGWLGSTYHVTSRTGARLVRIEAIFDKGPLPRTVEWSYSIGPLGIFGLRGATAAAPQA